MSNMLPSPDVLNELENGKFVLSNLAAKRAIQIREGAPPMVAVESSHPLTIALAEIAAGKIKPILAQLEEAGPGVEADLDRITEEPLPAELGMLLPALEEAEVVLIESVEGAEEDTEIEGEPEHTEDVTLSDLVAEEEEDAEPVLAEDDTLSLSDIAEQESVDGDEDEEGSVPSDDQD
jgi:DNA-directed RNA polymerase subunit omega